MNKTSRLPFQNFSRINKAKNSMKNSNILKNFDVFQTYMDILNIFSIEKCKLCQGTRSKTEMKKQIRMFYIIHMKFLLKCTLFHNMEFNSMKIHSRIVSAKKISKYVANIFVKWNKTTGILIIVFCTGVS